MPDLYLTTPNLEDDPTLSLKWLNSEAGRETLRLMGNSEANTKPSTLQAEEQRIRGFITSTTQRTWSLRYKGETIGAIWLDLNPNEYLKAPSVHIMIGDPNVRGKGVGQAVMQAVIELLEREGECRMLHSRYLVENVSSAKLLAKIGFSKDGDEYKDADGLMFQNVKRPLRSSTRF